MKRGYSVIFIILAFLLTLGCFGCFTSYAKPKAFADETITCSSKSAYLIDSHSGRVIFSKNENDRLPIASMCKIMTLLLCFEAKANDQIALDESITVSENAAGMGGSQVFLEANAQYIVGDLIKSIVVASANDACVAMAERLCGNEQSFIQRMNDRAKELGMENTLFANCTGLPKPNQYSSAKDVSIMFSELLKHEDYYRFSRIWTDKIIHPNNRETEISNTNKLIRFYKGCDSGKTGYTSEAGHCLAASAIRGDMRLISVVISSPDSKTRFKEVSSMFNYAFDNYVNKLIIDDKKPIDVKVEVLGGKKDCVEVVAEKSFFLFSAKDEKRSVEINFIPIEKVKAPITKGDLLGTLEVYENGEKLANINVLAVEDVLEKTYFDIITDISKNWALI